MKIDAVKTIFSLKAVNEFCHFLLFSSNWNKVQYRRCPQTCIPWCRIWWKSVPSESHSHYLRVWRCIRVFIIRRRVRFEVVYSGWLLVQTVRSVVIWKSSMFWLQRVAVRCAVNTFHSKLLPPSSGRVKMEAILPLITLCDNRETRSLNKHNNINITTSGNKKETVGFFN